MVRSRQERLVRQGYQERLQMDELHHLPLEELSCKMGN